MRATTQTFTLTALLVLAAVGNIIICESDYGFIRRIRLENISPEP